MVMKTYSISLDKEVVEAAKKIMYDQSKKLSPVINNFLKKWLKKQHSEEEDGNIR